MSVLVLLSGGFLCALNLSQLKNLCKPYISCLTLSHEQMCFQRLRWKHQLLRAEKVADFPWSSLKHLATFLINQIWWLTKAFFYGVTNSKKKMYFSALHGLQGTSQFHTEIWTERSERRQGLPEELLAKIHGCILCLFDGLTNKRGVIHRWNMQTVAEVT